MSYTTTVALVRNDIRLYLTDRRAVVIGVLVPILIAAFFGYVFGGTGKTAEAGTIPVAVVDEDQSSISKAITADLKKESMITIQVMSRSLAEERVRAGKVQVAVIMSTNFGTEATRALFSGAAKPRVELLVDPSQAMSSRVVEGLFAQHGMSAITKEAFSGTTGLTTLSGFVDELDRTPAAQAPERAELKSLLEALRNLNSKTAADNRTGTSGVQRGISIPYVTTTTRMTSGQDVPYNGYAHSFAGMAVQFILFAGIDAGVLLLLARGRGIWQRIRSAPLSKAQFLFARTIATTLISLFQFTMIYLAAMVIFKVRIDGSVAGFVLLAIAFCLLNATFGLMLAAIGHSAPATRGIATMVTLLLVMIGGAWVPAFVFPKWLQQASLAAPTRWAVDGLDAMTWRGQGLQAALTPVVVLVAAAIVCLAIAVWRFRWEE